MCVCVCANRRGSFKEVGGGGGGADRDRDSHEMTFMCYLLTFSFPATRNRNLGQEMQAGLQEEQ